VTGQTFNLKKTSHVKTTTWIGRNQSKWQRLAVEHGTAKKTQLSTSIRPMVPISDRRKLQLLAVDCGVAMEMRSYGRKIRVHAMSGQKLCLRYYIHCCKSQRSARTGAQRANTRDTNYARTKLGYRVTGQTVILLSSYHLRHWFRLGETQ